MKNFMIKGAPTCRIVYPAGLFEKRAPKGTDGTPKYGAWILVPKDDKQKIAQIEEAFMEAFRELQTMKFTGKTPDAINPKNNCLIDGDKLADTQNGKDMFRGYMILNCKSGDFRPIVTDLQKRVILNGVPIPGLAVEHISDEELHDGDYIFANVSFWAYNRVAQGIGCNVHAIMRAKEGQRIAGMPTDVDSYITPTDYE